MLAANGAFALHLRDVNPRNKQKEEVKLTLQMAMEAHRIVIRLGFHILQTIDP
jgi:hypothetical protein